MNLHLLWLGLFLICMLIGLAWLYGFLKSFLAGFLRDWAEAGGWAGMREEWRRGKERSNGTR